MNKQTNKRSPLIIAAEINAINQESRRMLLKNAIEVGRRLKEAKELLKHGEWMNWLKESVRYSKSTAENLMRLYEEYGAKLLNSPDGGLNSQPVGNLTYTQAILLLGLPVQEREDFIAQNDVGNMTKQTLRQALTDKGQAKLEKGLAPQENKDSQKIFEPNSGTITQLQKPVKAPSMPQKMPTHNLKTELDPNAPTKYAERCDACREIIANAFFDLTTALTNLAHLDPELKEVKRKEANVLMDALAETIKEWPPARKPLKYLLILYPLDKQSHRMYRQPEACQIF